MRHFSKEEILELRTLLVGYGARDTEFKAAHSFTRTDTIAIVQEGKSCKISMDDLIDGLINSIDEDFNQHEKERRAGEEERIEQENSRISAETDRQTNESNRQTAESNRDLAETKRVEEEANRAFAENSRESAETNRTVTFDELKSALQAAIEDATEAATETRNTFTLLSESEYKALTEKDPTKLYLVYEDEE